MKTIRAIGIGIGIWGIAVTLFIQSYSFSFIDDLDRQANLVLCTSILPLVWFGSHLYYKKGRGHNGYVLGAILFMVAALLDALITVPHFIIPLGGTHFSFFTDLIFWLIALELMGTAILYYHVKVNDKRNPLNA